MVYSDFLEQLTTLINLLNTKPVSQMTQELQNLPGKHHGEPTAFILKTLLPCEQRYTNIERELLAILWGVQKFHTYVYRQKVLVETDHKPLEAIFRKPLNECPPQLQRMLLKLTKYDLEVNECPRKQESSN